MHVERVGHAYGHQHHLAKAENEAEPVRSTDDQPSEAQDAPAEALQPAVPQRGVIRLLMAGHFKGVADVRLRINFHEEIMALQGQATAPVAADAAGSLVQVVGARVEELASSGQLTEEQIAAVHELQDVFHAQADGLREEFSASADVAALRAGLQGAFDELMAALTALLAAEPEPDAPADGADEPLVEEPPLESSVEPVEAPATADGGDPAPEPEEPAEPALSIAEMLAALAEAWDAVFAAMDDAVAATALLPPLSPPQGNGVAYAKFLAVYNDLYGIAAPGAEAQADAEPDGPPEAPLDVAV